MYPLPAGHLCCGEFLPKLHILLRGAHHRYPRLHLALPVHCHALYLPPPKGAHCARTRLPLRLRQLPLLSHIRPRHPKLLPGLRLGQCQHAQRVCPLRWFGRKCLPGLPPPPPPPAALPALPAPPRLCFFFCCWWCCRPPKVHCRGLIAPGSSLPHPGALFPALPRAPGHYSRGHPAVRASAACPCDCGEGCTQQAGGAAAWRSAAA